MKSKENRYRALIYIIGLLILAMGLTLILYTVFVLIEMLLHGRRIRRQKKTESAVLRHAQKTDAKLIFLMDFLQIPLSIVFTRFLNVFSAVIPDINAEGKNAAALFGIRLAVLALALLFTGVGAALSLNMRIVPNPGDGIVQAIADECHKSVGFIKNCVVVTCVATTIISSLVFSGKLYGVGIGTIIAMIAVGRIIATFNHFTKQKLMQVTGVEE